jgi:tRNA A37 methylthiotransferase MiaB
MTDQPTVYLETYGCQMNVSDSELMLGKLVASGYRPVDGPDGADVILVNTCAIRDHAEQRVIGRLGELKRHMAPGSILGVTGCMAQRLGPALLDPTGIARSPPCSTVPGEAFAPPRPSSTSKSITRISRRAVSTG